MTTCVVCDTPFDLRGYTQPVLYPDHCARCWLRASEPQAERIEKMPPKKKVHEPEIVAKEHVALTMRMAAEAMNDVALFEIEGQEDLDSIAGYLTEIKGKAKELATLKSSITKPMNEALKAVRELFAPAEAKLEGVEHTIKTKIAAFHVSAAERNRLAAQAAAEAISKDRDPSAALASMGSIANTAGVQVRLSWDFEILDADAVPRELCSPDMGKIRAFIKESEELLGEKTPDKSVDALNGIRVFVKSIVAAVGAR